MGMSAETLEHLFEPFFTTKAVGRGTGLGLASADGTIHQHGGWIEVESKVGIGSIFTIFLPITSKRPIIEVAPAHVRRSKKETILLVEDHPSVRRITMKILEKLGYHVLSAADGHEALEIWADHAPKINLLLTDMMMPHGMNGVDLGIRLREDNPTLKIVMVSGFSEEIIQERGAEMQNVRFLSKPYKNDTLARVIRDVFDGVTSPTDPPVVSATFDNVSR
jgi:CheY-like chemotaxis protein